jgi:hypothetical protein
MLEMAGGLEERNHAEVHGVVVGPGQHRESDLA